MISDREGQILLCIATFPYGLHNLVLLVQDLPYFWFTASLGVTDQVGGRLVGGWVVVVDVWLVTVVGLFEVLVVHLATGLKYINQPII